MVYRFKALPTVDSAQDPADLPSVPSHAFVDCFKNVTRSFLCVGRLLYPEKQQGLRRQIFDANLTNSYRDYHHTHTDIGAWQQSGGGGSRRNEMK